MSMGNCTSAAPVAASVAPVATTTSTNPNTLPIVDEKDEFIERTRKRYAFAKQLEKAGHKCVIILESYPPIVRWCEEEPCVKK